MIKFSLRYPRNVLIFVIDDNLCLFNHFVLTFVILYSKISTFHDVRRKKIKITTRMNFFDQATGIKSTLK